MSFVKIAQSDLTGKGVIGLPDTPGLQTMEMQEKFDEIALDVIVPKFNELSTELDDAELDEKISSDDITNMRLNSDIAIEISQDGGETWRATASSGHRIMDGSGTIYSQRSRMQFSNNVTIRDDEPNNATVIQVQPGDKGDKGDAATITIGNVQSGATPAVTNTGSQTDAILNFTFPKGDDGNSATIQVGTVTSGASASVTNRGTASAAIFDFTLPKGDKGDTGQGINILGEYATLADLEAAHPTGNPGNAYMVGTTNPKDLYIWDIVSMAWVNQGQLQGVKGDQGDAATITIGTVTSGATPSVINSGTSENAVFDFVLQPGSQGPQGNAGTIAVGTVTSGQTASVTNSGTSTAAVFDFVLPQGPQGPQGNPTTVNGKSGNNVTLYGSDIYVTDAEGASTVSSSLSTLTTTVTNNNTAQNNKHKVTSKQVATTGWTSDTTSQSGTTLYKKTIALSHVYVTSPIVDIGASGVLPTTAQQDAYDLLQYVTINGTTLTLYGRAIPSTAYYINITGVD